MARILIINPNTTQAMTDRLGAAAAAAAGPGTTTTSVQPDDGPVSIEGYYDGALAVPGVLATIAAWRGKADAVIIACFDDTGLDAARSLADVPVVGIGEAACLVAGLVCRRYSIVTTLDRSVPVIAENLRHYGFAERCAGIRFADVPVLDIDDDASLGRIRREIEQALEIDGSDGIVLGCAGMSDLAVRLSDDYGVPVVEGVSSAVGLAETLIANGLATSRRGGWQPPLPKPYRGALAAFGGPES